MAINIVGSANVRDSETGRMIESFIDEFRDDLSLNIINELEDLAEEVDKTGKEQEQTIEHLQSRVEELESRLDELENELEELR